MEEGGQDEEGAGMSVQMGKRKLGSAKPAYTLDVIDVGTYAWLGKRCRGPGVKGAAGLALVVAGQGRVRAGDCAAAVRRGDLVWLAPGDAVEVAGKKPVEVMAVYFDLKPPGEGEGFGARSAVRKPATGRFGAMLKLFETLLQLRSEEETLARQVLIWANVARLLSLASAPGAKAKPEGQAGPAGEAMKHVLGRIESRLGGPLALPELAAVAGLSRAYFAQWFGRMTGQAPMRYVRARRIERAKVLLSTTDLTVGQVAGQVGFEDPAHFNRVFRRAVGEPPLRYARGAAGQAGRRAKRGRDRSKIQ